jgi:signal transduction histidine kinase
MVLAATSQAEAAQRGFLISDADSELSAYRDARRRVPSEIDTLKRLTVDNPRQQKVIGDLATVVVQRLARLDQVIQLKSQGGVIDQAVIEPGRRQRAEILKIAESVRAEEQRLLNERQINVERTRRELVIAVGTVFALSIGLLVLLRVLAERDASRLRAESTRLRAAQRQLVESNQLLEQRVEERTEQLTDANAELQAFAHTVAHDLRAPLRNVEGFSTALIEDEAERLSEEGKFFASRIRAAVARMDQLITDLLAYSRLSRSELRLQPVNVGRVIHIAQRDLAALIEETHADVVIDTPLPVVRANEGVLVQVVENLISNALKFVGRGVVPRVRIYGGTSEGRGKLYVEDNGIGIEPEHHERIFGVFERLHGQERYPGTGIGLAIVKKGVERMGGSVTVQRRPEGGTRFEIELPAAGWTNV